MMDKKNMSQIEDRKKSILKDADQSFEIRMDQSNGIFIENEPESLGLMKKILNF